MRPEQRNEGCFFRSLVAYCILERTLFDKSWRKLDNSRLMV